MQTTCPLQWLAQQTQMQRPQHKSKLQIERRAVGNVTVIDLYGALDADSEKSVESFMDSSNRQFGKNIILNLDNLRSVNGNGIGVLINALVRLKKSGAIAWLVNISPNLLRVFDVHRVLPALKIHPDIRSALNQIGELNQEEQGRTRRTGLQ